MLQVDFIEFKWTVCLFTFDEPLLTTVQNRTATVQNCDEYKQS